jgi:hypothetical protein
MELFLNSIESIPITNDVMRKPTTREEIATWSIGDVPFSHPETIQRELKEFRLFNSKTLTEYSLTEAVLKQILIDGEFSLLKPIVHNRLFEMLNYYVPKYFCSFFNTDNIPCGELYFGLTDDGEVTGVVIPSIITESQIRTSIMKIIADIIKSAKLQIETNDEVDTYLNEIEKLVQVDLIELNSNVSLIHDWSNDIIAKQQREIDRYKKMRNESLIERYRYRTEMFRYHRSVELMVNDQTAHKEIIEFIQTHRPNVSLHVYRLNELRQKMIDQVVSTKKFPIVFDEGQILREKTNINNIAYWITEFRDMKERQIRLRRPEPFRLPEPISVCKHLALSNPIYRIMNGVDKESSLKVCIIRIVFPGHDTVDLKNKTRLSYCDSKGNVRTTYRTMSSNGPCCKE